MVVFGRCRISTHIILLELSFSFGNYLMMEVSQKPSALSKISNEFEVQWEKARIILFSLSTTQGKSNCWL
jgi:hypothetical protein